MCGLTHTSSWRNWADSYGNKLKIYKNGSIKIIPGNNTGKITDIYSKSSFEFISNNSYWAMFVYSQDSIAFWFIGNDGVLRVISRIGDKWVNTPPLLSGSHILKMISVSYTLDEVKRINIESAGIDEQFNCSEGYMTSWPPENSEIKQILEEKRIA